MNGESRPKAAPDVAAAESSTTTLPGVLLAVEIDLRQAARRLEHLAVTHPQYTCEARIVFLVAGPARGDRLVVAA